MWIAINLEKIKRFTTKGINLSAANPVSWVDPNLEPQFMSRIRTALIKEEIIQVHDDQLQGLSIPKQGKVGNIEESDVEQAGAIDREYEIDESTGRRRVSSYVITMPDEDGNINKSESKGLILTGIESDHDKG